jgi:beta-galactosidase
MQEKDAQGRQWEQRVELMRDAIIYNRNNPSILFYEECNKTISEAHMRELKKLRDRYDPFGGRAAGCREMLDSKEAEYGGEMLYVNRSAGKPMWAMEYSRDEGLRKYWDNDSPPFHKDGDGPLYRNKPANEYNRNQDSHAIEDIRSWVDYWRERPGTGRWVSSGGVNIIFSDTNTHFRGAENYRRSGEVDPMRIPKDSYYCNQVMWDGWVDVEKPRIYLMGHWNYKPGTRKNITVASSTCRVELFINGQSRGFGEQQYRFLYTFKDIEFEPGIIEAVGYNSTGNRLCTAFKKTIGEPDHIKLTIHTAPEGLLADGTDLALIDVEVVDKNGDRNPVAFNMIDFELEGPAEWRGGIAQGPDNYILAGSLPVELGVNRVLIRSTISAGTIKLSARSKGLQPATVMIESAPVPVKNGLSETMPGDDLPSFLERGPAPPGPLFSKTRIPIKIVDATAGVNSDQAQFSYDDNEMTQWSNDNRIKTGWVQYELEKSTYISEVTLKLGDWRWRAYPVRISVDGKTAFTGTTEKTLGYTTLSFKKIKGKHLKIELTGAHTDKDAFMIEELDPSNQAAEIAGREQKGQGMLSIIEIEVYQNTVDKNFESE